MVGLSASSGTLDLPTVGISRELAFLKIQANLNDPMIFRSIYCPTCQEFLLVSGLFPAPETHTPGHGLAWLPAVDEPILGRPHQAISDWLEIANLSIDQRHALRLLAPTSNSMCWALLIEPGEREGWFEFLADYLDDLVDAWLEALNGKDTRFFKASEIWLRPRPALYFTWLDDSEVVFE